MLILAGAYVVILARKHAALDIAKADILKARKSDSQTFDTISVDLTVSEAVCIVLYTEVKMLTNC
jgi:hypothetical protein